MSTNDGADHQVPSALKPKTQNPTHWPEKKKLGFFPHPLGFANHHHLALNELREVRWSEGEKYPTTTTNTRPTSFNFMA